jgi:photosystem II stability/assembly factor-like uncharacterized protein
MRDEAALPRALVLLLGAALSLQLAPSALAQAAAAKGKAAKPAAAAPADAVDKSQLQGLEWRSIGPFRGGRVVAVAGVVGQPRVFYFGGTGGGVFKTTDGGLSWAPITDGQIRTGSVGALAVAASDPNVIYVGMGESCIRGNVSHGDGVYRSTDAGKTWAHVGLEKTEQIGRLLVHPKDPDLVYVAALGHTFGPNPERGVFRSRDGGRSWEKVLFVDDKTGAVDIAMDATNPRVLYAAFWQASRTPWSMDSGGPGSSLWKSTDGGDKWTKLEHEGLPKKSVWGRVGVTVSPANPNRVWAIIEAEDGGVFRSDDAGKSWRRTNENRNLRQRAWYYTHIYADPKNEDVVYVLNVGFWKSIDGGRNFAPQRTPHSDNHDLWIDPEDSNRMVEGNDGGANVSYDGGRSWTRQDNQATAQFYHVIADDQFPYKLYGAQQDNSTVGIASRTQGGGIGAGDWYPVAGCESGTIAVHPKQPEITYAGCYGGYIGVLDRRTGQERDINVYPDNPMGWGAEGMKYRFQWTFPIAVSPHDAETLYAAGNVLFKSTTRGESWEAISPDLTRNDPSKLGSSGGPITKDNTSVEYYGTIFAFAESPVQKGVLWAGSDDGLVHVSKDAGKTWENVTPPEMRAGQPLEWSMVSQIDASAHDAGTAFLAVNRYKWDDKQPLAYVTTDFGRTWRKIVAGIAKDAFVRVVRQDRVRKDLLFAGTETGVYASIDGGARWQPLQLNLPVVPVTDLIVKDDDVAISTQGRSFWILDDIAPLRQWSAESASAESRLLEPSPAYRFFSGGGFGGGGGAVGRNPQSGAWIYFSLKSAPKDKEEVSLEFLDASGKSIRRISNIQQEPDPPNPFAEFGFQMPSRKFEPKAGLNRYVWNLRGPDASRFPGMILWGGDLNGPTVVPGSYQVKLTVGGESQTKSLEVRKDPRLATTQDDFQKQFDLLLKIRDKLTETHDAISRIREAREQMQGVSERAKGNQPIADAAKAFGDKLTAVEEALYQTKNQSSQDPLNYPIRLNNKLAALAGVVSSAEAGPTRQSYVVYDDLVGKIDAELAKLKTVLDTDLPAFNALVKAQDVPAVVLKKK